MEGHALIRVSVLTPATEINMTRHTPDPTNVMSPLELLTENGFEGMAAALEGEHQDRLSRRATPR